jgi:hypothetical protein
MLHAMNRKRENIKIGGVVMKMFKNIMLVVALLVMNVVDAKQVGGAKAQSARVTTSAANQEKMLLAQQEEALRLEQLKQELAAKKAAEEKVAEEKATQQKKAQEQVSAPSPMAGSVSSEDWDDMEDKFYDAFDAGDFRTANRLIRRMENVTNPTRQQKTSLRRIKQFIKQQSIIQQAQSKKQSPLRSAFGRWWSGEAANVENYKYMILAKLNNVERYPASKETYPTLESKEDALKLGIEFFDVQYNDQNIMEKAIKAAKQALSQASDNLEQETINVLNNKMRKQFKFDVEKLDELSTEGKIVYLENYLKNNKAGMKEFVVKEMTDGNVVALSRAIISEIARINAMITSLKSLTTAQAKSQKQVPVTVPQGKPSGSPVEQK